MVVCRVRLNCGAFVLVDEEDLELFGPVRYRPPMKGSICGTGKSRKIKLHREVARRSGLDVDGRLVDHIDGDPLNNTRGNLRIATYAVNARNRASRPSATGLPRGVRRDYHRYEAHTTLSVGLSKPKFKVLGRFDTAEEAHAAYLAWIRENWKDGSFLDRDRPKPVVEREADARSIRDAWLASNKCPRIRPDLSVYCRGEEVGTSKLTADVVRQIRSEYDRGKRGFGMTKMAEKFGVHRTTLRAIVRGDSWAHLLPQAAGDVGAAEAAFLAGGASGEEEEA